MSQTPKQAALALAGSLINADNIFRGDIIELRKLIEAIREAPEAKRVVKQTGGN